MTEPMERDDATPAPETDRRFKALVAEARQIEALPTVGEVEVRRLAEIVDELNAIVDDLPESRIAEFNRRWHLPAGRAIDIPVVLSGPTSLVLPHRDHIHWAGW